MFILHGQALRGHRAALGSPQSRAACLSLCEKTIAEKASSLETQGGLRV